MVLAPGRLLGTRYQILELLGQGGMGAVYKARDLELDRVVALKVIRPDLALNSAILRRFKQELILARQVTHRNVIRIFDLGEADNIKFITMEYIEGKDLRALLREKGKFAPADAAAIVEQVCRALEAAHVEGVIHRDLKPQNIMLDNEGKVFVMDFGIARSIDPGGGGLTLTHGALVGTPEYMSPEQAKGEKLDARTDLFSLGIIFYELLTGDSPYKADTTMAALYMRTSRPARPPIELVSDIPHPLNDIVVRCLEIDREKRYASASEIVSDLAIWRASPDALGLSARLRFFLAQLRAHWQWTAAGAVVLLLAVGSLVYAAKRASRLSMKPTAPVVAASLAILPFQNSTGDPSLDWLGASLADMLSTDVGQSSSLRIVSPDRLHQILRDYRISENARLDPEMLKRIAEASSADTVVSGQYAKFGNQIRIDATLTDLKHDRRAPLKIEAANENAIPKTVDGLAELIRKNLAVSSDVIQELKASSFQPTSSSLAALRSYNQGVQLMREGKNLDAIKTLQTTIKQDPQFALAYARLAEADSALGYDTDAEKYSRKAVDLSQNLPAQEKYRIAAAHARMMKDYPKAIAAYENLAKAAPGDADVQSTLGGLYLDTGAYQKAREQYAAVLKADPQSVEALWKLGGVEIMSDNPRGSLDYLTRGLSLSIQQGNDEKRAVILQATGIAYRLMNKPDEALDNYQQALVIERRINFQRGAAASLNEMGQVYSLLGKPDAALASFKEALKVRNEIGAKKEAGDSLIDLGNLYLNRGQQDQALSMYKDSLKIQRDARDETNQALCLNNFGVVYLHRNDNENALTYLQQALQLRQKLNVPPDIAETLQNLGVAYANTGQDREAMTDFMQALDLYRKSGDNHGAATQSHNMAFIFERQGRYGAAVDAMQDALKTLRGEGDRSIQMAQALNDFAQFLAEAGKGSETDKPLEEAQMLARDLKNESLQAAILNTRGDVRFYGGDSKGAMALYSQAASAAARGGKPDVLLTSKINVAKAGLAEGHLPRPSAELTRLAQQADALGLRLLSMECSIQVAQTMLNGKENSRARQLLEQSLGTSEKQGLRLASARIRYLLGTSLRLSGQGAEATSQYREAVRLLDEMKKEPGQDHLLDRSDLKSIYADSTRWAESARS